MPRHPSSSQRKTIDLHRYSVDGALAMFREEYEKARKTGIPKTLDIVHGIGSVEFTGGIRRALRALLETHKDSLRFQVGEDVDGNAGHTIVWPIRSLVRDTEGREKRVPIPPVSGIKGDCHEPPACGVPQTGHGGSRPEDARLFPQKGQERQGELCDVPGGLGAVFARCSQIAQIENPNQIPARSLVSGVRCEFYIVRASKRDGILARFIRVLRRDD